MRRSMKRSLVLVCALALLACFGQAQAAVHDATADFNTTTNGTGGWWYEVGTSYTALTGYGAIKYGPDPAWDWSQDGWRGGGDAHEAVAIKNAVATSFDIQEGDLLSHAATSIAFVADASTAGDYTVDLEAWGIRDNGRTRRVQLYKNDTLLTSADLTDANSSRSSPYAVASGLAVTLGVGDVLRYANTTIVDGGDYVGVNFTLTSSGGSTIPEPSTVVLLATGLIGLMAYAWRKRK